MLMVVALGGNAVSLPGKEGNIADQFAATRDVMRQLADVLLAGHQLVITHGNGPQVGNVMRRVEIAAQNSTDRVYPLPLDIVVADTEAGMGYMMSQCLMNELQARGHFRLCSTIVTTVRVDPGDPAMQNPTKPVGPFMTHPSAQKHVDLDGWKVVDESPKGWRRVVPSPLPREIVELPLLKKLVSQGEIVVAAGGGGIPVMRDANGMYTGVEAVIDKDRTSGMLAVELAADRLVILSNVDQVMQDFGKPTQRALSVITADEAEKLHQARQFPPGSMGPKVEAAIEFVRKSSKPDAEAMITSCERFNEALAGKTGTRIVRA